MIASGSKPLFLLLALMLGLAMGVLSVGCGDESTDPTPPEPSEIPAPTSPENVVKSIEVIYNDDVRNAQERLDAYANLLSDGNSTPSEAFIFKLQPGDIINGLPPAWGRDAELAAHRAIFDAQAAGDIYSLELRITHDPAQDLTPPEIGRDGWKEVFATNVYLRLMFNTDDGLEVKGGQANFGFPPAANGQFKIAEWIDLPRPSPAARSVESSTWGSIKAGYGLGDLQ